MDNKYLYIPGGLLIFSILIAVIIGAGTVYNAQAGKRITNSKTQLNKVNKLDSYYCETVDDCILVDADCCGCPAGGKSLYINKNHKKTWKQQKQIEYIDVLMGKSCLDVDECPEDMTPACINNKCAIR